MDSSNQNPVKPSITQTLHILADKMRMGHRHTTHLWGAFRVHYSDGTQSRRQSWKSAQELTRSFGGKIVHEATGVQLTSNNRKNTYTGFGNGAHA